MSAEPRREGLLPNGARRSLQEALERWAAFLDRQIPPRLLARPEDARRARLMMGFGSLGSVFGLVYALFYLLIGHYWGVGIVMLCTTGVMISPLLMCGRNGSVEHAADFFAAILTLGFLGLCFVEGGVHGHAIAWLVSVPLCALILTGTRAAIKWVVIAFLAAALIVGFDLAGMQLPLTFDPKWDPLVTAAGYLGLVVFMFILGFIFENGREHAFERMREAVAELEGSNGKLVAMNQEKNEFLGIAAHDLKNPLTVIMACGELLRTYTEPSKTPQLAEMITSASQRMHRLITDLLDVNAIEEGRFASNLEKCDLADLVRQCVEYNLPGAEGKGIVIARDLPEGIHVKADAVASAQILDNLISNAVKYSPLKTTVLVQIAVEKDCAVARIRDQGPGISAEDQKRLFQKFCRLSASPTGGESSTGLGLAIAKKLAEAMDGSVECQSALGQGATFSLRLKLWPKAAPGLAGASGPAVKTGKVRLSIDAASTSYVRM